MKISSNFPLWRVVYLQFAEVVGWNFAVQFNREKESFLILHQAATASNHKTRRCFLHPTLGWPARLYFGDHPTDNHLAGRIYSWIKESNEKTKLIESSQRERPIHI
jgi:hypothetical protein